jgi:AcrR family transcriptional regulator
MPAGTASRPDVRTRILDTAFGLLADHGVAYLTQPRVSRAAGVRQSHLTYYFPTRGDLLVGVARHSMEALAGPLLDRAQSGRVTPAQLPAILTQALTDRRRVRAVLGLIVTADEDPEVREALRELLKMVRAQLAEVFAALGMPSDPDSVALVHTFVVGAAVLHHARADEAGRREAEAAVRFITGAGSTLHAAPRAAPRPARAAAGPPRAAARKGARR